MRTDSHRFRLVAAAAATGLVLGPAGPWPARAQPAPPDQQAPDQLPIGQQADPPARVGRIARISGTVSHHTQDATQWSPASRNYPVTAGDAFWTEPRAEAEIELGESRIAMAGGTELDIGALDAATVQATEPQGEMYIHLRSLAPGESFVLQTPRATVTIGAPGRYAIVAGDTENPTLVTVLEGTAQVSGQGIALEAAAAQTVTITGTDTMQGVVGPARQDPFVAAMLARERPPPRASVALPPVVARMPGGEDLNAYGAWESAPEYGPVWYPQVAPGWAPYRDGHWAYVAPWGWTWIDDAPWGFAPFHYGRWADIDGRWAWTPGVAAEPEPAAFPVYAPALVTFFGIGAGVALGAAFAAGSIGWCPLGPREVYHPWYHASPGYVRQVNVNSVTSATQIDGPVTLNTYVNRGAATVVPAAAVVGSQPIGRVARPVDPTALAAARPLVGSDPIRPTAATAGVTPAVARHFNLAPGEALTRPGAPGPAIRTEATGTPAVPHRPPLVGPGRLERLPGAAATVPRVAPAALPALRRPDEIQAGPPPIARMPGVPTAADPERAVPRPGLSPSNPAGPAVVSGPARVPPRAGASPGLDPGVAGQPHPGAASPLAGEPQRPIVHAPTAPAVPHQPSVAAPHPVPVRISPIAPPAHVAAPLAPQIHATPPVHVAGPLPPQIHAAPAAPQMRNTAPPQAHLVPAPSPQVHVAPAPPARVAGPPPQAHTAPPPPVHVAPAAAPQKAEKRPGER